MFAISGFPSLHSIIDAYVTDNRFSFFSSLLIEILLKNDPMAMVVGDIYTALATNYPNVVKDKAHWKNSVRHTLSFSKVFSKIEVIFDLANSCNSSCYNKLINLCTVNFDHILANYKSCAQKVDLSKLNHGEIMRLKQVQKMQIIKLIRKESNVVVIPPKNNSTLSSDTSKAENKSIISNKSLNQDHGSVTLHRIKKDARESYLNKEARQQFNKSEGNNQNKNCFTQLSPQTLSLIHI